MLVGDPGDKEVVGSSYYIADVSSLLFESGADGRVWLQRRSEGAKGGGCDNIISVCCISGANQRSCVVFRCNRGSVLNFCAICASKSIRSVE